MGFQKTRFSELVFFGCLAVLLRLRSPLRPSDQSDMFPHADPYGASLSDHVSEMIVASDDPNPVRDSSVENFLIENETLVATLVSFCRVNDGERSEFMKTLDYNRSFMRRAILPYPTLVGYSLSTNSSAMFCHGIEGCGVSGKEERIRNISYKSFVPTRYMSMGSTTMVKLNDSRNATNVKKKEEKDGERGAPEEATEEEMAGEEEDEEQIWIFQKHQTPHQDNNIHHFSLPHYDAGVVDQEMCGAGTFFNNGHELIIKVIYIIFGGIIVFVILSIIKWKRLKNEKFFKSNNWLDASLIFGEPCLDKSYFIDQILYENLLKEAILISEGSSGKVFKVMFLGLECAMKVFYSNARMDFRKESIVVTNLDHPHVVNFFCCFRKSFIIMELMDEDLFSFINKLREKRINYKMSLEVALDVMLQIAKGMSYLHNQGIAHQDLKSLNILLKFGGEFHAPDFQIIAKIADFGSARSVDPRCAKGFALLQNENLGTFSWRAPELFHPRGRSCLTKVFGIHPRIMPKPLDIYGFAIICSELVTKQIPYSNGNDQRVVLGAKIRGGHRPTLPPHGCPGELIALIQDCWQTNPRLRPEFHEICTRLKRLIKAKAS